MPIVELKLDSSKSVAGLKQYDSAVDKSARKTDTAFDKMKGAVKGLALPIAAATTVITVAIGAIGKASLAAASDMEETQGKFDVVFRNMGDTAENFAQDIADSYGLSERASKQYLSSIQDLLVPTGLARDKAAEMSDQFVRLAADLGSFNNLPTKQVVMDIQSALAGGSETMTKYGIDVKVAAVQSEILALGLDTSTEAAERMARTTALLSIMQRDSSDAMGDFARTSGSFANQQKILNATLENIRVEIGSYLLPIATKFITALNTWLKETNAINTAILWTVKVIRFVHDGIAGLILIGDAVVMGFAHFFDFMISGFTSLMKPLDLLGQALVKMGAIENNPFDSLKAAAETFKESSTDVFNNQLAYIQKSSAGFDKLEADIRKQGAAHNAVKNVVSGQVIPAEKALESQVNGVTAAAKASTDALYGQAAAANAVNAATGWAGAAAAEQAASGVGVSLGGQEARYTPDGWQTQSEQAASGSTIVNITTPVNKNNIADITSGQTEQAARV